LANRGFIAALTQRVRFFAVFIIFDGADRVRSPLREAFY
jgi:hypothetical protein